MDTKKDREPSSEAPHCVVEEYSVGVPMVRPKVAFLQVLKLGGAKGEVFTVKEICGHLKNYISLRSLYDVTDPRIVHCGDDLLGSVFGVAKFTINDALGLINKNCFVLPDMCWKRKRRLVSKPFPSTPDGDPRTITIAVCHAPSTLSSAVVTSSSSIESSGPKTPATTSSRKDVNCDEESSPSELASASVGDTSVSADTTVLSSAERCCVKESVTTTETGCTSVSGQADCSKPEQSKPERKRKHQKGKRKSSSSDGSSRSRKRHHTEPSSSSTSVSSRRRGTSLSITYHDDEASNSDCPWCIMVKMKNCSQTGDDNDDESEVLSIQDKETISVRDSSDDYWFLEEDAISVHVDSDTEFSFEYELESDKLSQHSESDISSVTSGNGLLVVCQESDVEFFADYSDTESESEDRELTDGDKWICTEGKCNQSNLPMHRYCIKCWKIRSDWLPRQRTSRYMGQIINSNIIGSKSAYDDKIEDEGLGVEDKSKLNDVEMIKSDTRDVITDACKSEQGDSGVCVSSQTSSQETVLSSGQLLETNLLLTDGAKSESIPKSISDFTLQSNLCPNDGAKSERLSESIDFPKLTKLLPIDDAKSESLSKSLDDLSTHQSSLLTEAQSGEIRHSFSNIQVKSLSSSSLESSDIPSVAALLSDGGVTTRPSDGGIARRPDDGSVATRPSDGDVARQPSDNGVATRPSDSGIIKVTSSPLDDPCIVCLTQPKNASLIHGASGHQVCCFMCAKRLKRRGKVCPVCRRPIQKVVKNYIL